MNTSSVVERVATLIILIPFAFYIAYLFAPEWIGWVEHQKSFAIIDSAGTVAESSEKFIKYTYFNKYENKRHTLVYRADDNALLALKEGNFVIIEYQPGFPYRIEIFGIKGSNNFNDILGLLVFIGVITVISKVLKIVLSVGVSPTEIMNE